MTDCIHNLPSDPISTCDINKKLCLLEENLPCIYLEKEGDMEKVLLTIEFTKDGDKWCAMAEGRTGDLQNSYAGFGDSQIDALIDFAADIKRHVPNWRI